MTYIAFISCSLSFVLCSSSALPQYLTLVSEQYTKRADLIQCRYFRLLQGHKLYSQTKVTIILNHAQLY